MRARSRGASLSPFAAKVMPSSSLLYSVAPINTRSLKLMRQSFAVLEISARVSASRCPLRLRQWSKYCIAAKWRDGPTSDSAEASTHSFARDTEGDGPRAERRSSDNRAICEHSKNGYSRVSIKKRNPASSAFLSRNSTCGF
jgi:hypothetical protein